MSKSKKGKREYLGRTLESHVHSIQETFKILEKPADSSIEKVDWSEIIKLGDEISKQATVAGMLWSGETNDVKDLESNMDVYCNKLHGFLLLCHGSTGGAGPTLLANIVASAKQVIDCSISLLRESVSLYNSSNAKKKQSIPQLSGSVWEACNALKKTPTTNCTAIIRAITQVAVSIKDVLREMKELKPAPTDEANNITEDDGSLSEGELGDDLSPEEMGIAESATDVVSHALLVVKEVIRFITNLLKKSNRECAEIDYVNSLERLLSFCEEMGFQVNELGACAYPPQELSQMKLAAKKIYDDLDEIHKEVVILEGSPEGLNQAFEGLKNSLSKLECVLAGLTDSLTPEMGRLTVQCARPVV